MAATLLPGPAPACSLPAPPLPASLSSHCFTLKQPHIEQSKRIARRRFGRSSFLRITVTVIFLRFSLSFCVNKRPQSSCHHHHHPRQRTPSTWPRPRNWDAFFPFSPSLSGSRFRQFIHSIYATPPCRVSSRKGGTHVCHIYDIYIYSMLYSMPAIYIQLAGERTHFTPPSSAPSWAL